ncbi:LPXTG cell wall anchor domain-containing protein, partial [Streptococcus porcinus]|uniref:LPXTG cell wall anchor domain-containing protein n=1 Tax=Streptococcus porcinus TaxID=1340 RepID=UPI001FAEADBF
EEALAKELDKVKVEKEALQAEIDKLKEEHKKEVDALNALLAEKDDIIKRLEEQVAKAKEEAEKNAQLSEEEKAKLQKELDQAKKELADMLNKMPNKVEPHTGGGAQAGQANASTNHNAEHLPSTGEKAVNPLLVATGLSLIIGAGAYTYAAKRKKN